MSRFRPEDVTMRVVADKVDWSLTQYLKFPDGTDYEGPFNLRDACETGEGIIDSLISRGGVVHDGTQEEFFDLLQRWVNARGQLLRFP